MIKQCCTNGTVALQCADIKIRYNIRHIKQHTDDTTVEYIDSKLIIDDIILGKYFLYTYVLY